MVFLFAATSACAQSLSFEAERAFAELLFGRYFEDPCANITSGAQSCRPTFGERLMQFRDQKAAQTYRFEETRCIIRADTLVTATGERYAATFNLQNVLYVNLNKAQQEETSRKSSSIFKGRKCSNPAVARAMCWCSFTNTSPPTAATSVTM